MLLKGMINLTSISFRVVFIYLYTKMFLSWTVQNKNGDIRHRGYRTRCLTLALRRFCARYVTGSIIIKRGAASTIENIIIKITNIFIFVCAQDFSCACFDALLHVYIGMVLMAHWGTLSMMDETNTQYTHGGSSLKSAVQRVAATKVRIWQKIHLIRFLSLGTSVWIGCYTRING